MRYLRLTLAITCLCLLHSNMTLGAFSVVSAQGLESTPDTPQRADVFQITLAELDYAETSLNSPYDIVEYTLRLPENWELQAESFFELDFSYTYDSLDPVETQVPTYNLGHLTITIDGEKQSVFQIRDATLEHSRLRVDLPFSLLNSTRKTHVIEVILDASHICQTPHQAHVTLHPTSYFSLTYEQSSITADLALYPRPFYQRSFETDQARFVLPVQPTEKELAGAMGIAAKLGDLTSYLVISGIEDLELLNRLDAPDASEPLHEHLIVIGKPESNEVIGELGRLGVLPVPLQERQFSLTSAGPATVAPDDVLTYDLAFTNTTLRAVSSFSLVDELPAAAHLVTCSPECTAGERGKVTWSIPSLEAGETLSYTLALTLSEWITNSVMENTITLFDAASEPLNVSTLTTTVSSTLFAEAGQRSSSNQSRYFFRQGERAVPENDGIVQELVSPWDQTRVILVITGLSDESVYKASQAMSFESYFPGMNGQFALVRDVRPLPDPLLKPLADDLTFADLGYEDKVLEGYSPETNYYIDIPASWNLNQETVLDLHFGHSQLLDYNSSYLNVLFNSQPAATIAFSDETSLNGTLRVELPAAQTHPGQRNKITIQAGLHSVDRCVPAGVWLFINSTSLLHLDYTEHDVRPLSLDFYPHPFDLRSDLADVLFVLPPEPLPKEWEGALQIAATLGDAAGGPDLMLSTMLGNHWPETALRDYHLITIGRPLRSPLLQQVNAQLPQPFLPGSDLIEQKLDQVILPSNAQGSLTNAHVAHLTPSSLVPVTAIKSRSAFQGDGINCT